MRKALLQCLNDHPFARIDAVKRYVRASAGGTTAGGQSHVRVQEYFDLLTERLRSAFPALEHITVTLEIADIELSPRTVSSLGQLVNELFTNSMKRAFHDRSEGTIETTLSRLVEKRTLLLEYQDDGPGLPPTTNADADADEGSTGDGSFGTILIEALTSQLNAAWDVGPPPGVHYRFRFEPKA